MKLLALLPLALLAAGTLSLAGPGDPVPERRIPVIVRGTVEPDVVAPGEPIPLTITIENGFAGPIHHPGFRLAPVDWHGETANVSLMDIYRDGRDYDLFLARPVIDVPGNISGMGSREVPADGTLLIRTDARKWKLRGGWLPGRYEARVRVDQLLVDPWSRLSVRSDPFCFEIRE